MNHRLTAVAGILLVACGISAEDTQTTQKVVVKPESVVLLEWDDDPDRVEFCNSLGIVETRSPNGLSGEKGEERVKTALRAKAAARGANVVRLDGGILLGFFTISATAFDCSAEAMAQQAAKTDDLIRRASEPVVCDGAEDCEIKWARGVTWLQDKSKWKFRNVTDTLITTEGPMETASPAFEMTKVPLGGGKYRINLRGHCEQKGCERSVLKLKADFHDSLLAKAE